MRRKNRQEQSEAGEEVRGGGDGELGDQELRPFEVRLQ